MKIHNKECDKTWPFYERRYPTLDDPNYLGSLGLANGVRKAINQELVGKQGLKVLDVGCGKKPFFPWFQPYTDEYVGTDISGDNSLVDKICPVEALDVEDGWADVVLCFSVLEHVDDPHKAVKELFRVSTSSGIVLAATHGCFPWHPFPQDHWRWTQTGLPLLFKKHGGFDDVNIFATRGTASGCFFLLSHAVYAQMSRGKMKPRVRHVLTKFINKVGEYLDSRFFCESDINRHVTALPEFFVIAKKTSSMTKTK